MPKGAAVADVKACPKSKAPDGKGPEHRPLVYQMNERAYCCEDCDYKEVGAPPAI